MLHEMILKVLHCGIAFLSGERLWEMAHDARIGVHGGEGGEVGFAPGAHGEARGGENEISERCHGNLRNSMVRQAVKDETWAEFFDIRCWSAWRCRC